MGRIEGNIVDVASGDVVRGVVEFEYGRIVSVRADHVSSDRYILPPFVDSHVHVESSMLPPAEFARISLIHGTAAAVCDPHEVANVLGLEGVRYMMDGARRVPYRFYFAAPSCVPATEVDTPGARLDAEDVDLLLAEPSVVALGEVMDYVSVVRGRSQPLRKIRSALDRGKRVDGHAPGLRGEALRRYVETGITTDHECASFEEAVEKIGLGMKIQIREGSAARNLQALLPLLKSHPAMCMLCSDDKHPDDLLAGHIDKSVRRAVAAGVDVFDVLRAASLNPVEHYGLGVGLLRVGDPADFIVVDDLRRMNVLEVYVGGVCVAREGESLLPREGCARINRFHPLGLDRARLRVPASGSTLRVIRVVDGELVTGCELVPARVRDGVVQADPERDICKVCVVNRYGRGSVGVGFVRGFGLRRGAIASSVAHDSHNVVAVGVDDAAIVRALSLVEDAEGGLAAVTKDEELVLPLPVAGLMSEVPAERVACLYGRLNEMCGRMGSPLRAPFMTMSFLTLLVIPELKIHDKGLYDCNRGTYVPLFA